MAKHYNLEYLEEISGGDKDFISDMLTDFFSNTPQTLEEIRETIIKEDWNELYKILHRFIPSFDFVGAENLIHKLRDFESKARSKENLENANEIYTEIKLLAEKLIGELKTDFNM